MRHEIEGSSMIKAVEDNGGTLRVEFLSGDTYDYEAVGSETIMEMLSADSIGGYFAREIRPFYNGSRVG